MHGLAKRHDLSRNLIRIWVQKYEAGDLDDDMAAAHMHQEYKRGSRRWSAWLESRPSSWSF